MTKLIQVAIITWKDKKACELPKLRQMKRTTVASQKQLRHEQAVGALL